MDLHCATAHPVCPPWQPCLHIKDPSTNSLPPKLLPTTLGVYPHVSRIIVRASRSVFLNRVVHQSSLPLEFVASRGLSLMLMSRRKVHAGFSVGWTCPQSMLRRAKHNWSTLQTKRVLHDSRLVRCLLRPQSLDRWCLLRSTLGSLVCQYHRFQQGAREQLLPFVVVRPLSPLSPALSRPWGRSVSSPPRAHLQ